jgi:hypothetical protein
MGSLFDKGKIDKKAPVPTAVPNVIRQIRGSRPGGRMGDKNARKNSGVE